MINLLPKEVDEENDQTWRYPWQSNIAMLLHDRYGITDWDKRNQAATDILNMIYDANWELIDYRKDKDKENKSDRTMYYGIESIHGSELGYSYGWRYVAWELGLSGAVYDGIGVYTRRDNAIRGIKRYAKRRGFNWIISEK